MNIKPANKSDMKSVEKLFTLPELSSANGEYLTIDDISKYIDKQFFLVAKEGREVVGAMFGERLKGEGMMLWEFAVKCDYQGKGVGSMLLESFEKNMVSEGRKWMILYAPAKSPKTINFYKKRGYNKGKSHVEFLKFFDK